MHILRGGRIEQDKVNVGVPMKEICQNHVFSNDNFCPANDSWLMVASRSFPVTRERKLLGYSICALSYY